MALKDIISNNVNSMDTINIHKLPDEKIII